MTNSKYFTYYSYLKRESIFGYFYRRFILYPFLRTLLGPIFLDVGCGLGIFLSYGTKTLSVGLDINPYNVHHVNLSGNKALLINPPEDFPVNKSSFPACIIDQVLEHVDDPSYLISQSYNSLSPGGKLIVGLPCQKGFLADPDHKVYYTAESIVSTLTSSTDLVHIRSFYFPINLRFVGRYLSSNHLYVVFRKPSYQSLDRL